MPVFDFSNPESTTTTTEVTYTTFHSDKNVATPETVKTAITIITAIRSGLKMASLNLCFNNAPIP